MDMLRKIQKYIGYIGVPKEQRLDYYLQKIVSSKTGFNIDKIDLISAEKTNMKEINEFNSFVFKYKGLTYKLLDDELNIIINYNAFKNV